MIGTGLQVHLTFSSEFWVLMYCFSLICVRVYNCCLFLENEFSHARDQAMIQSEELIDLKYVCILT